MGIPFPESITSKRTKLIPLIRHLVFDTICLAPEPLTVIEELSNVIFVALDSVFKDDAESSVDVFVQLVAINNTANKVASLETIFPFS